METKTEKKGNTLWFIAIVIGYCLNIVIVIVVISDFVIV